tara:strand:- start:1727 stop:1906 length:180 start_codon:yes stop_codon:yes gene_type:complete
VEDMSVPAELYQREMKEMNDQLYTAYQRIKGLQQELSLLKEMYNEISEDGLNYESLIRP